MSDLNVENINPASNQDYNFGLEGVYLMYSAENLHQKRLQDLESKLQAECVPGIQLCQFDIKDVQRHPIIEHVIKLYNR